MTTETIEEKAHFDTECDIAEDEKLYVGDLVRLRSGGPVMTINRFNGDDHAECAWFVDRENVGRYTNPVQSHEFAAAALQRVGGASPLQSVKDACDPNKVTTIEVAGDLCAIGKPWRDAVAKLAEEAVQYVRRGVFGVCVGYYNKQSKMAPDIVVSSKPFTAAQLREHIRKGSNFEVDAAMEAGEKIRPFLTLRVAAAPVGGKDIGKAAPGIESAAKPTLAEVTGCLKDLPGSIAEQLRQHPLTVTRSADGVKTAVQVEPGQSAAEVLAKVGKGRAVVVGNKEATIPLTRAEEMELRMHMFAEVKASPASVA